MVGASDLAAIKLLTPFAGPRSGMQDLGTLDGDVLSIDWLNDSGIATGISANADFSAFPGIHLARRLMMDLNSLSQRLELYLLTACSINAPVNHRFSVDVAGDLHAYLATPLTAGEVEFETGARPPVALPAATQLRISRLTGIRAKANQDSAA